MKDSSTRNRRQIPLYGKLVLWQLFNLLVLAALFFALPGRNGVGWNVLLTEPVRERLLAIASDIATAAGELPQPQRNEVLAAYSRSYGVSISLYSFDDHEGHRPRDPFGQPPRNFSQASPSPDSLPPDDSFAPNPRPDEVSPEMQQPGRRPDVPANGAPANGSSNLGAWAPPSAFPGAGGAPPDGMDHPPRPREGLGNMISIHRSHDGEGYIVRIPALERQGGTTPKPHELVAHAEGLGALLGFLGVGDWVLFGVLIVAVSALLWSPFIWGVSRTIIRMTEATQRIAQGRFEARVSTQRHDELGQLAGSINHMAERLEHHVEGQKQFLIDIAHEVTSPLARIQIALGLLGPELEGFSATMFHDIEEDVQQMSALLNELLLYSRADFSEQSVDAERIELQGLIDEVIEREDPRRQVQLRVDAELSVMGRRALLARALANLVRNALRHAAGASEPIELSAVREGVWIWLRVADRGPGVPEAALARLGEPFFRPQASRSRDSGGTGLGLAIVRRCVLACEGEVNFINRSGGGFIAEIRLSGP